MRLGEPRSAGKSIAVGVLFVIAAAVNLYLAVGLAALVLVGYILSMLFRSNDASAWICEACGAYINRG